MISVRCANDQSPTNRTCKSAISLWLRVAFSLCLISDWGLHCLLLLFPFIRLNLLLLLLVLCTDKKLTSDARALSQCRRLISMLKLCSRPVYLAASLQRERKKHKYNPKCWQEREKTRGSGLSEWTSTYFFFQHWDHLVGNMETATRLCNCVHEWAFIYLAKR